MAELDGIDLNSQLIGRGLNTDRPQDTYVDFANNIVKNQQSQASQEAAIARAQELAKQSKLDTASQQKAADAGYVKELADTMTPESAVLAVKSALAAKGIKTADAEVDAWGAQLKAEGRPVAKSVVEDFLSRTARAGTHEGKDSTFTTEMEIPVTKGKSAADMGLEDMHDADGKSVDDKTVSDGTFRAHVPADGQYQVIRDSESGQPVAYNFGGEARVDHSLQLSEKENQFWTNQWKSRIANKVNPFQSSSRTQTGVALQSLNRCVRALATLGKGPVTKQDMQQVILEIGNVYKGGSPDQAQILETSYQSIFGEIMGWLQKWTGKAQDAVPNDILSHVEDRIRDLEDQSRRVVVSSINSTENLNQDVIEREPFTDMWAKFKAQIQQALSDANNPNAVYDPSAGSAPTMGGTSAPAGTHGATPAAAGAANPHMDAIAAVLGLKKKAVQGK